MKTLKKILVPTDLTLNLLAAIEHASNLGRAFNAEIHIMHAVDCNPYDSIPRESDDMEELLKSLDIKILEQMSSLVHKSKIDLNAVSLVVKFGDPVKEIIKYAEEENFDLVIMTSTAEYKVYEEVGQSIAHRVSQKSGVQVIVIKPALERFALRSQNMNHTLLYDYDDNY